MLLVLYVPGAAEFLRWSALEESNFIAGLIGVICFRFVDDICEWYESRTKCLMPINGLFLSCILFIKLGLGGPY